MDDRTSFQASETNFEIVYTPRVEPIRRSGPHRCWTKADEKQLWFFWGSFSLPTIAKKLKRSQHAVAMKARALGIGAPSRATISLSGFSRETGYSITRIRWAAEQLGLCLHRVPKSDPRQKKHPRKFGIEEEQQQAILAFLKKVPDGQRIYRAGGKKSAKGVWGVGQKPPGCFGCTRTDIPHYALGLCKVCYLRPFKQDWYKKKKAG